MLISKHSSANSLSSVSYTHLDVYKRQTLRDDDELMGVKETTGDDEIIIAGSNGKAVRFHEDGIRAMGRTASGVKGFNVDGSVVVGVATSRDGTHLLAVSENGYGKRTAIEEYRLTTRGAKGVKTINITQKTGDLVSVRAVNGDEAVSYTHLIKVV